MFSPEGLDLGSGRTVPGPIEVGDGVAVGAAADRNVGGERVVAVRNQQRGHPLEVAQAELAGVSAGNPERVVHVQDRLVTPFPENRDGPIQRLDR